MKFRHCLTLFATLASISLVHGQRASEMELASWVWDEGESEVPSPSPVVPSPMTTTSTSPVTAPASGPLKCPGCSVTPEYNPICGTDRITYTNPSQMKCAQLCGAVVSLQFHGSCQ